MYELLTSFKSSSRNNNKHESCFDMQLFERFDIESQGLKYEPNMRAFFPASDVHYLPFASCCLRERLSRHPGRFNATLLSFKQCHLSPTLVSDTCDPAARWCAPLAWTSDAEGEFKRVLTEPGLQRFSIVRHISPLTQTTRDSCSLHLLSDKRELEILLHVFSPGLNGGSQTASDRVPRPIVQGGVCPSHQTCYLKKKITLHSFCFIRGA